MKLSIHGVLYTHKKHIVWNENLFMMSLILNFLFGFNLFVTAKDSSIKTFAFWFWLKILVMWLPSRMILKFNFVRVINCGGTLLYMQTEIETIVCYAVSMIATFFALKFVGFNFSAFFCCFWECFLYMFSILLLATIRHKKLELS